MVFSLFIELYVSFAGMIFYQFIFPFPGDTSIESNPLPRFENFTRTKHTFKLDDLPVELFMLRSNVCDENLIPLYKSG